MYKGHFVNNVKKGFGSLLWKNGSRYCGFWLDDQKHGFGILNVSYPLPEDEHLLEEPTMTQSIYHGNWNHDVKDGYGILNATFKFRNQTLNEFYEGSWKNNHKNGFGRCITKELTIYLGEFRNGDFHGYGILTEKTPPELRSFYHRTEGLFYHNNGLAVRKRFFISEVTHDHFFHS